MGVGGMRMRDFLIENLERESEGEVGDASDERRSGEERSQREIGDYIRVERLGERYGSRGRSALEIG
ncbi:hypothetical protein Tco_1139915 [Tanacetum coccineum]